uniref:Uncharacterized protein n=1 Tax=Sipha flava TaxID=143950 RepID=A0A2S2QY89_9HEMI
MDACAIRANDEAKASSPPLLCSEVQRSAHVFHDSHRDAYARVHVIIMYRKRTKARARVCVCNACGQNCIIIHVYSLKTIETNLIFQFKKLQLPLMHNILRGRVHYAVYHMIEVHIMYCVQCPLRARTTAVEYAAKEIIFISSWCLR